MDRINALILKELLKDGRKTFTEIAQQCGESMEVIASRYRQMKKQGIIVGATIQNSCACYDSNFVAAFIVFTRARKTAVAKELLKDFPNIIGVYSIGINPSIFNALFVLKSISDLELTKQAIKVLPEVMEVDTQLWVGVRNSPYNLSVLNVDGVAKTGVKRPKENRYQQIDEVDRYIIEKLVVDSKIPFSKIAEELKIATDTVSKRYERLKQNNHIRPVIQIDPNKIGYSAYAFFMMQFSEDSLARSIETLSSMPDINLIHKTSGKFDCWASLMIRDIDQFTIAQEKILQMDHLTNVEVTVHKIFSVWPLPREFISTF
jgi:Lrp/AsnC family transcriptional regulator for asnA, asnC and gidA